MIKALIILTPLNFISFIHQMVFWRVADNIWNLLVAFLALAAFSIGASVLYAEFFPTLPDWAKSYFDED